MGLDIYLYARAEQEAQEAFDKKWEDLDYSTASEEQKKQYHDESNAIPRSQDVPSEKHPDNINNRRYLRSSYNGAGFNSAVPQMTSDEQDTYYGIFEPVINDGDQYLIELDDVDKLLECRTRAVATCERLKKADNFRATSVCAIPVRNPERAPMGTQALAEFREEHANFKAGSNSFGGAYSNAKGDFWMDEPLKVVGAIPGIDVLGRPCVHLVYEAEPHPSYLASAEVLVEFIDEAIELVKQDGRAYIHWSG